MKKISIIFLIVAIILFPVVPINSPAETGGAGGVQPEVASTAPLSDGVSAAPDIISSAEDIEMYVQATEAIAPTPTGAAGLIPNEDNPGESADVTENLGAVQPENGLSEIREITEERPAEIPAIRVPASWVLGVKEQYLLPVEYSPVNEADTPTYSSGDSKIASVNPVTGLVSPKKVGKVRILVKSASGAHASCEITVKKAPSSISLSKKSITLGEGETYGLRYTLSSGSASKVTLESNQPDIASIDETGKIEANSPGVATIVATTFNKKKATCTVTVLNAPESVSLGEARITLGVGQVRALPATLSAGSAGTYAYSSSNPDAATVDSSGNVTAKAVGEAVITVQTYNGKEARCEVTVKLAPSKVSLGKNSVTLGVGEVYALDVALGAPGEDCYTSCTFASKDKNVATVSPDGAILAKKTGSTTITVKTHNGKKTTCKVEVAKAPSYLSVDDDDFYMGLGETYQLKVKMSSGSSGKVTYHSSDESIATVDESGWITARGISGDSKAEIVASTYNGKSVRCFIRVYNEPTKIVVPKGLYVLEGGREGVFIYVSGCTHQNLSYVSSDPSVAEIRDIDHHDLVFGVLGKKPGTSKITVTAYNGVFGTFEVTVIPGPSSISINLPSKLECYYQYNLDYFVKLTPADTSIRHIKKITISNKKYAVWNTLHDPGPTYGSGRFWLAPIKKGRVTITVETWSGKKVSKTLTIVESKKPNVVTVPGQIEECPYLPA